jgi:hypothetical protein
MIASLAAPAVAANPEAAAKSQAAAVAIPVRFSLDAAGYATLVIEDAAGNRVRNLIAETQLPAGDNLLYWDGYDDGVRDERGNLVRKRVAAGQYRVRGLTHDGIHLTYEFPIYSGGNPPWKTPDKSGAWMADHTPPLGAVFLPAGLSPYGEGKPQVLLSAIVAEAGDPLIFADKNGQRIYGEHFFGWDGGIAVTRDMGTPTDPSIYAYAVSAREEHAVLRALRKNDRGVEIAKIPAVIPMPREPVHIGVSVAVYNGLAVVSMPVDNKLVFIDTKERKQIGTASMPSVRGVYFDSKGSLFVISDKVVKSFRIADLQKPQLSEGKTLIGAGLEAPQSLTGDDAGNLYVADWGKSHQVKVFDATGKPLRTIGKAGGPQLGLYDEERMHYPMGLTIDDQGRLWNAEADHLPKRISVWNAGSGKFEMAKYGPPHYGGGSTIDPVDPTRAFFSTHHGLMEFALDWKAGVSKVNAIVSRKDLQGLIELPGGNWWPERPVRVGERTYLVGGYQSAIRTNQNTAVFLFDEKTHIGRPVAYVGSDRWWPSVANDPAMKELMPGKKNENFLTWSDLNGDGNPQPNEINYRVFSEKVKYPGWNDLDGDKNFQSYEIKVASDGKEQGLYGFREFYPQSDLSMVGVWGIQVPAPSIRADGVPLYDLAKANFLIDPRIVTPGLEDGEWLMPAPDGTLLTSDKGYKDGRLAWSYPARDAYKDVARGPGDMNVATRALGPVMKAPAGEAGHFYAWNGEKGNIFLLTTDGLFIQQLGGDMRSHPLLRLPEAKRGMSVDGYSFEDEHFHPTMTRTDSGDVFLVAGKEHSSIFRVTGWETIKRRDFGQLNLLASSVASLPEIKMEPSRQQGRQELQVALRAKGPAVDGQLSDWDKAAWASIDASTSAAVSITNDTLFAAWRTNDAKLLANGGGATNILFKSGGALDLMIGAYRLTDKNRVEPVEGDLRLLITQVNGQPRAILYRAVVPKTAEAQKVLFESPVGKVLFDEVRDVSSEIKLAQHGSDFEISVPLALLGLKPDPDAELLGDIGVLRGNGSQTIQRQYWNNLNTAIVSDVPSEARLQPRNWGTWKLVQEAVSN